MRANKADTGSWLGPEAGTDLEGPGWRSCQHGNGAKREQNKVQSFGPEVEGD